VLLASACIGPLSGATTCVPASCPFVPSVAVQFRIVERTGRVTIGPGDEAANFAVQARVVGAAPTVGIANASFDVRIVGEPDANGVLARGLISSPDHTYSPAVGISSVVGVGGLASQFSYLAFLNPVFNGAINTTVGVHANGPDQEILLVSAQTAVGPLLQTPGVDNDGDGNPDAWPGSGSGAIPVGTTRVALSRTTSAIYFGADAHWVDIYRFRYTVTNFAPRTLRLHLDNVAADVFSQLAFSLGGQWGPWSAHASLSATDLLIGIVEPVAAACCGGNGSCTIVLPADCGGVFLGAASCAPSPCATPVVAGACCDAAGVCSIALNTECTGFFVGAPTCSPIVCPSGGAPAICCIGACCQGSACTISTAPSCASVAGAVFSGVGIVCGSEPNPVPCCPANFNGVGGVTVQDILDFITAWFAADTRTDFNHDGVLAPIDLLDFLTRWMSGC
jgi:hypothetical protein